MLSNRLIELEYSPFQGPMFKKLQSKAVKKSMKP